MAPGPPTKGLEATWMMALDQAETLQMLPIPSIVLTPALPSETHWIVPPVLPAALGQTHRGCGTGSPRHAPITGPGSTIYRSYGSSQLKTTSTRHTKLARQRQRMRAERSRSASARAKG
ncbi:hypothetical protein C8T65DRAFT_646157 [Cerioporus squamosus]|nr:hypothetical protein C8T65DRAFT_646157 [Cerioporus squamosus]